MLKWIINDPLTFKVSLNGWEVYLNYDHIGLSMQIIALTGGISFITNTFRHSLAHSLD